jgi:transposase
LKGFSVKTITRDLSPSFDWFSRQFFCNSMHIVDKFHIIRHLLDSCQDVRVRYRQELLSDKRLKYQAFKQQELANKQHCKENNKPFVAKKFTYKSPKLSNGETALEALSRSRYLLYKYPQDWTETQQERAIALFKDYFANCDTNAIAEAMNSKIQRMITINKGTINKEFFFHKMKNMLSST